MDVFNSGGITVIVYLPGEETQKEYERKKNIEPLSINKILT